MRRGVLLGVGVLILVAVIVGLRWLSHAGPSPLLLRLSYQASRIAYHTSRIANDLQEAVPPLPVLLSERLAGVEPSTRLVASGFIQAYEIMVSTEVAGRVRMMQADVGDEVTAGQILGQLDTALMEAQIRRAEAELGVAEAAAAKVKAGASLEEIKIAEAAVATAEEQVASAEGGVALAQANVMAAQAALQAAHADLSKLRSGASAQDLALAESRLDLAQRHLRGAESARDSIGGAVERGEMPSESYDAANAAVAQAQTRIRMAQLQIEELRAGARPEDVQAGQAAVMAAQAGTEAAEAEVVRAQRLLEAAQASRDRAWAQLDSVAFGATKEQIAMVQAQVSGAQAARQTLVITLGKMTLRAPREGLVMERTVNAGEVVVPGSTLFHLVDLERLKLTVYVPESDIGRIQMGQLAHISVDSFPERVFPGRVVYISPRAEFTPSNVQTTDERVMQVFAVKVEMHNPDHALKPGMPAEAAFVE